MNVNVFDPFVSKETVLQFGGNKIDNLDEGLKKCDYLSLHVPLPLPIPLPYPLH